MPRETGDPNMQAEAILSHIARRIRMGTGGPHKLEASASGHGVPPIRSPMDALETKSSQLTDFALQMLCAGVEWLREERPDLVVPVLTHLLRTEVQKCANR